MIKSAVPKTNAMLICDYVITETETNKKSLIGIFETIGASQFPVVHHSLSVYVKLTEANGIYRFQLDLTDLKTDSQVTKCEIPEDLKIDNPLRSSELVFNLRGLKFPHPGEYEFRIYANGLIFGQKSFLVSEIKK
jgi:hypothetical protein